MSRKERLRRELLNGQIPTDARISDVQALYEDIGWTLSRIKGSHYQFTKDGERTMVVAVHGEKVGRGSLTDLAKQLNGAEGN